MKKTILLITCVLSLNICANDYKILINKSNYDNSVSIEDYVDNKALTCTLPEVLNQDKTTCVDPILNSNWIYHGSDTCNGMRQANFDPNIYFTRANMHTPDLDLVIPVGYHWVTKGEYITLFNGSTVSNKSDPMSTYANQCGLTGHAEFEGVEQYVLLFSGGGLTGMHAGNHEYHGLTHTSYEASSGFLGYVLYKD